MATKPPSSTIDSEHLTTFLRLSVGRVDDVIYQLARLRTLADLIEAEGDPVTAGFIVGEVFAAGHHLADIQSRLFRVLDLREQSATPGC